MALDSANPILCTGPDAIGPRKPVTQSQ